MHGSVVQGAPAVAQTRCVMIQGVAASSEANMYLLRAIARRRADRGLCVIELDNIGIGRSMAPRARKEYTIQRMTDDVAAVVKHVWEDGCRPVSRDLRRTRRHRTQAGRPGLISPKRCLRPVNRGQPQCQIIFPGQQVIDVLFIHYEFRHPMLSDCPYSFA